MLWMDHLCYKWINYFMDGWMDGWMDNCVMIGWMDQQIIL